jgi:hypothetical protein
VPISLPLIQCGLASVDLKRCYFFQDCPKHLPSLFPSLRFAEPLGPFDELPHALRSHFVEVGASVRAERSARRTKALAAAAAKGTQGTRTFEFMQGDIILFSLDSMYPLVVIIMPL